MANSTIRDGVINFIESNIQKYPVIEGWIVLIQERTGIKNRYVALGLVFTPLFLFLMPVLANMITIFYPLYMSVMSIEKGKNDRTRWLVYWLLFHAIQIAEALFGWMLRIGGDISLIRFGYLVWCLAPVENNGCVYSYGVLKPYILQYMGYADKAANEVENVINDNKGIIDNAKEQAVKAGVAVGVAYAVSQNEEQKKSD